MKIKEQTSLIRTSARKRKTKYKIAACDKEDSDGAKERWKTRHFFSQSHP